MVRKWRGQHITWPVFLEGWLANSPDLNPIENVWAYVKRRVAGQGHKTFDSFKSVVLHELGHIPREVLSNLFNSMPTRLTDCISHKGERLDY